MKLIGIKLHGCDPFIRKTLKENTWYPFGQYQEPTENNGWKWQSEAQKKADILCTKMYQVMADEKNESLDITVNCIVGKNGSGKSTEILHLSEERRQKNRSKYSNDQKLLILKAYLTNQFTSGQIYEKFGIGRVQLWRWKNTFTKETAHPGASNSQRTMSYIA